LRIDWDAVLRYAQGIESWISRMSGYGALVLIKSFVALMHLDQRGISGASEL